MLNTEEKEVMHSIYIIIQQVIHLICAGTYIGLAVARTLTSNWSQLRIS